MILVSLASDTNDTPSIDSNWEIFKTTPVENSMWGQYEFFLYSKFKAHWINGVNMFSKYGQHELAQNNCTVCAGAHDFDFSKSLKKFKALPPNTIVFDDLQRTNSTHIHNILSHSPGAVPTAFVASYTNFMKLVSIWKWIDSYRNEPKLLDTDDTFSILRRTMWQRNIQYTSQWNKT